MAAVLIPARAKIQYFSAAMLKLDLKIFNGNRDTRSDAWADFCNFYFSYLEPAYRGYVQLNREFEKPYSDHFRPIPKEKPGEELKGCLEQLTILYPEKTIQIKQH